MDPLVAMTEKMIGVMAEDMNIEAVLEAVLDAVMEALMAKDMAEGAVVVMEVKVVVMTEVGEVEVVVVHIFLQVLFQIQLNRCY
jgi:formaldehyde-activating enzyme involved in methanogenesis